MFRHVPTQFEDVDVEEAKAKPKRLIRRPVVIDRTGLQTSQIYDLIAEKRFPAPVPIGARAVAASKRAENCRGRGLD